jgi:minor extracellular serine protease Vpr
VRAWWPATTWSATTYNAGGTPEQQVPVPDENPDDCGGHGSHVAGIVGGNGGGIKGVAPNVQFGAYRVFGCATVRRRPTSSSRRWSAPTPTACRSSTRAWVRARQWPQYPTAQASSRLTAKGVVMVASTGNNGPLGSSPDGLFAAGAPGTGSKVIATASFDNAQRSFDGRRHGRTASTRPLARRCRPPTAACRWGRTTT